jgi:beta-1,2-mannobiose phosphorylase / 1,2-beta-oligomannan phosphorylase
MLHLLLFALLAQQPTSAVVFPKELTSFDPEGEVVFEAAPGKWDAKIRERGWIVRDNGKYRMWYTGYRDKDGTRLLGSATSIDGSKWVREPGNPLLKELWVEDMMVVKRDGVHHMFAEGKHDIAHRLTSRDGLKWNPEGSLDVRLKNGDRIPPGPYGTPTVWFEDDVWRLLYERKDSGVWLATSKDLKVWTNVRDEPVLSPGPEAFDRHMIAMNQVIKRNGRFYALYHGLADKESRRWTTCLAASDDLLHWKKYPQNPLVTGNKSSGIFVETDKGLTLYTMHDVVRRHRPLK